MKRKYYDLSSAQQILFTSQQFTIYRQVNNVCTSVLLDIALDFDILREAIKIAYQRNDSFRIRLIKVKGKVKQYFADHEDPNIGYLDFSDKSFEEMEKVLYKIARKRITKLDTQMSKIYMMHSYDNRCGLYFAVSHMIMDSWAITTFYKDVFAIYQALKNGTEMPKPLYAYEDLLNEELNYKNTIQYQKDRQFWEDFYDDTEPLYTHVNGYHMLEKYRKKKKNPSLRHGPFFKLNSKASNVMLPFPKELVSKMEKYCIENKITVQSLIILALRNYLAKVNQVDDVSIYTVVARRSKLKEKYTGGSRVHYMPLRTIFDDDDTYRDTSEIICQKLSSVFKHCNTSPLEVSNILYKKFDVPVMATHYIGIVTFQPVRLVFDDGVQIKTKWYGNGTIATPFYLTIMDGDGTGGLKFYYEYHKLVISYETIKNLHEYLIHSIELGIQDNTVTIKDMMQVV